VVGRLVGDWAEQVITKKVKRERRYEVGGMRWEVWGMG